MDKIQTRSSFAENAGIPVDWEQFTLFLGVGSPQTDLRNGRTTAVVKRLN